MPYWLRHPLRWLLHVDCIDCREGCHQCCENYTPVCYCRIIKEHR